MQFSDVVGAVVNLIQTLGLLPFIAAGAVIALAATLYRRARR